MKNILIYIFFAGYLFLNESVKACETPSNITIDAIYIITNSYDCEIEYGNSGFIPTGTPTVSNIDWIFMKENMPQSQYIDFYIRKNCGSENSAWAGPYTFYNYCQDFLFGNMELNEYFETDFIPTCWSEADSGAPISGIQGIGNSNWEQSILPYDEGNDGAKIFLNGTDTHDWLVLPLMQGLGLLKSDSYGYGSLDISFQLALTQHNSTLGSTLGTDDKLQLVYSTNSGQSWILIEEWNQNTPISNTGQFCNITITVNEGSELALTPFLIAFWASSGSYDDVSEMDLFIDNLWVSVPITGNVSDSLNKTGIALYPNPTTNEIIIHSQQLIKSIQLTDIKGNLLKQVTTYSDREKLNLSDFPSGIYIVQINTDNQMLNKVIIKE